MVHFGNIISTLLSYDAIFFQQLIEKNYLNGFYHLLFLTFSVNMVVVISLWYEVVVVDVIVW